MFSTHVKQGKQPTGLTHVDHGLLTRMAEEKLVTPTVAARSLGVHVTTLARWRRQGLIEPAKVTAGGQARYLLSDLHEQVEKLQRRHS